MTRTLRAAAAQYAPVVGDPEGNRSRAVEWTQRAIDAGAQLVVLPELASSGYVFNSEDEAASSAEPLEASQLVGALQEVCAGSDAYVVAGLNEQSRGCRFNTAIVVGPDGLAGAYRKLHLFNDEKTWFTPGSELPLFELPFGKLGVVICFDMWFPEPARALALAGADVIAVPTNWVASFKRTVWDERGYCQGDYVAMATAAQSGVALVCADRVGEERGTTFIGASIIVAPDGWPAAGPASGDGEELLVADIDLEAVARARRRTPRNHLHDDRRPDAYRVVPVRAAAIAGSVTRE